MRNVAWLALGVTLVAGVPSCRAGCTLTTQWEWVGAVRSPTGVYSLDTPVVVQLTDDDGDGRVGSGDVPDVVFTADVLTVLNGRDGSDIFTSIGRAGRSVAAGDLDGDGVVELVTFGDNRRSLVAYRHDGSVAWQLPTDRVLPSNVCLGLADVDQDGSPEIYYDAGVHAADGSSRWQGTPVNDISSSTNVAVDLQVGRPGLEILANNTCYAADGAVLWSRSDIVPGHPTVGDLDGDGEPEVIFVGTRSSPTLATEIHVLDALGTSLGSPLVVDTTRFAAPAALVDLEDDGRLEIVVPMGFALDAYEWNGTTLSLRWTSPVVDDSCCGGASAFDVDADGTPEIFYRGSEGFYVIDGGSGALLDCRPGRSLTGFEIPVVADIDNDGIPEIVVTGGRYASGGDPQVGSVTAYECGVSVPSRCIWNQQTYHVTNVNDDGTIPRVEVRPWTSGLGSLEQEARGCAGSVVTPPIPDFLLCEGESATLDGSSFADPACPGGSAFAWKDALGTTIGTGATLTVTPTASTIYGLQVTCPGDPGCGSGRTFRVVVEQRPLFSSLRAGDPDDCNLGIELTWDAATFRDPSGTGTYSVYRSEVSCLDAAAQPPLTTGITSLSFVDATTLAGHSYFYVVQAEDARTITLCSPGPNNGGAVNVGVVCVGPVLESPDAYTPDLLGWALRAGHVGDVVTMAWPGSRAPLPGEHFHVLKSYDEVGFARANLEGDLSTTWTETDTSRPLQFFDVRIANLCEIQSLDDEPPGWDVPHP